MGKKTGISWTNKTFNPWWGCTNISAGCDLCYAETLSKRFGLEVWGPGAARRQFRMPNPSTALSISTSASSESLTSLKGGWGVELSPEYYADGVRYCQEAEAEVTAPTLFDLLATAE